VILVGHGVCGFPTRARLLTNPRSQRSCSRHIIHESSLLSFPMLGSYDSTSAPASGASASHFALTAYSSMALSSFTVSGRRSFGGANADIERLNNPHQQPDAPEEVARDKESASQRKKRKQAERDGATVTGRTLNVNTPRPSAGAGRAVLEEGSAGKKQKTRGQGAEAFAKPGGFEGARAGGAKGKGRQAKAEPESDFDADASFDEAALDSSESSEDEGEGESSEGEVEAFLKSAVAPSATSLAVAAAEAGFIDDEAPALEGGAAEAGLTKNQKRKLAMKRAKEEADKRKGRKGGP